LNRKILKLEDFDINDFLKSRRLGESKELKEKKKEERMGPFFNLDLTSYLPLNLNEHSQKNLTSWLSLERHQEEWKARFGDAYVELAEEEGDQENPNKS